MATVVFTFSNVNFSSGEASARISKEALRLFQINDAENQPDATAKLTTPTVAVT